MHLTLKGHKICEPCSGKGELVSCPTCKSAFMGRDYGMEAFVRELSGENLRYSVKFIQHFKWSSSPGSLRCIIVKYLPSIALGVLIYLGLVLAFVQLK